MTIATLVEYTGLSQSTFTKPNIRGLLSEQGDTPIGKGNTKASGKKQNKKASDKDKTISDFQAKNTQLEQECELLRQKLFLLMQR